jgi:hypothetical protein
MDRLIPCVRVVGRRGSPLAEKGFRRAMKARDARTGRRHRHDIAADPRLDEALEAAEKPSTTIGSGGSPVQ